MLYAQKAAKEITKSWETPKTAQKHKKTQMMMMVVVQRNPQASTFHGHLRPLNWSTEISPQLVALIGWLNHKNVLKQKYKHNLLLSSHDN